MSLLYRSFVRPLLMRLDAETAHDVATGCLRTFCRVPGTLRLLDATSGADPAALAQSIAGLAFPLPVGLAAGFDKRGDLFPFFVRSGFGFAELGTFTALPQAGNPRPRMFRYPAQRAIVNRLGFNNPGAEAAAHGLANQRVPRRPRPRGLSIGKSRAVDLSGAAEDQARAMVPLAPFADYWTLNVSSPNTPGLRQQQEARTVEHLVATTAPVAAGRPVFLKLAPDLDEKSFDEIVEAVLSLPVAGLVLTNTTLRRDGVEAAANVEGGLSGAPLRELSTFWIRRAFRRLAGRKAIIGVGGIFDGRDALEKLRAGASLVQVYTGYVFEGPGLPRSIHRFLAEWCDRHGTRLSELVGQEEEFFA